MASRAHIRASERHPLRWCQLRVLAATSWSSEARCHAECRMFGLADSSFAEMYIYAVSAHMIEVMSEMTVSDARARLADVVDAARVGHDPVYLTRRGQRVAAVIASEDLDRLIAAAEDLADIEAARAARAEIAEGEPAIPWEQVKADLGLA